MAPTPRTNPGPIPVTASWSTPLPDGFARIGISRGPPRGQCGYRMYRPLAPGPWFKSVSADEYRACYMAQLNRLDPNAVLQDLAALAVDRVPALLCFENAPPDPGWCHRGFVSAWFHDMLGLKVVEFGHADRGAGWNHPKLPG